MKTLITGGSGFIGKRLLSLIDNSMSFDIRGDRIRTLYGDICSYDDILKGTENIDGILHLAAISRVSDCERNVFDCIKVNILGTLNVIEAAINNNVKWLALVTTGEVVWIQNDEVKSFNRIDNLYGITKLTDELFLDVYNAKYNLNSIVFRISSVVFGGTDDNPNKVFPMFVKKAVCNEKIFVNDITSQWDFIHVDSVVSLIGNKIQTIKNQEDGIVEVDISSGIKLNLVSLAKMIHYLAKSSSVIEYNSFSSSEITETDYKKIVMENNITEEFISSVFDSISEYKLKYNNVR